MEGQGPEGHVLQGAQECPVPVSFSTSLSMFCSFFPAADWFFPLLSPCEQKMPLAKNSQVYTGSPPKSTQALSLTEAGHSLSPTPRGPLLLIAPSPVIPHLPKRSRNSKIFLLRLKKKKKQAKERFCLLVSVSCGAHTQDLSCLVKGRVAVSLKFPESLSKSAWY